MSLFAAATSFSQYFYEAPPFPVPVKNCRQASSTQIFVITCLDENDQPIIFIQDTSDRKNTGYFTIGDEFPKSSEYA